MLVLSWIAVVAGAASTPRAPSTVMWDGDLLAQTKQGLSGMHTNALLCVYIYVTGLYKGTCALAGLQACLHTQAHQQLLAYAKAVQMIY